MDDDAAALVGHLRDVVEDRQQIVGEGNEIREEDVVELLGSGEILGRSLNELELPMSVCRSLDHRAADSMPTPLDGSTAASRSPEPQPSSSTDAFRGTRKRVKDSTRR